MNWLAVLAALLCWPVAATTQRLRELIAGSVLEFERVACACLAGTEGTPRCNYGPLLRFLLSAEGPVARGRRRPGAIEDMTPAGYIMLHLFPAGLLAGAIFAWPYGYFSLLRWVVCVAALWIAYLDYERDGKVGAWILALSVGALLFNPIVPVHLTRDAWFFLDLGMAGVFGAHLVATRRRFGL